MPVARAVLAPIAAAEVLGATVLAERGAITDWAVTDPLDFNPLITGPSLVPYACAISPQPMPLARNCNTP